MCIIIAKPRGAEMPSKDILRNSFNHNSDGAGFMFVRNGKVHINKGFMDFNSFYNVIEKLGKIHDLTEHAIVMHFRISTGGNVDSGNCHPYPITSNKEYLRKTKFITDLGMAHNGTISTYSTYGSYGYGKSKPKEILNDTQKFIANCVSTIKEMDNDFLRNPRAMKLLEDIADSKLCFLDTDENIHLIGDFINDDGVFYSNGTYLGHYSYPRRTYFDDSSYYDSYYEGSTSDYYKSYEPPKYLSSNLILDGQKEPLEQEVFDLLYEELLPLMIGEKVDFDGETYKVGISNKFFIDGFYNLYSVDKSKRIIGLIAENVEVY